MRHMYTWGLFAGGASVGLVWLATACTARQAAKSGYEAASEACITAYQGDGAGQRSCLEYVRNKYTEAGAPPAAQLDGGSHE